MDRVTAPAPSTLPADPAELARLDAYFGGFGVTRPDELRRLAAAACAEAAKAGARSPTPAAVRLTAAWLRDVLELDGVVPEALVRLGRAAFVTADAARLWPGALLGEAPEALTEALRHSLPIATPPLAPLAMPAQSLRAEPRRMPAAVPHGAFGRSSRLLPAAGARAA